MFKSQCIAAPKRSPLAKRGHPNIIPTGSQLPSGVQKQSKLVVNNDKEVRISFGSQLPSGLGKPHSNSRGLNPCQDGLGHLCSENGSSIRYFPLLTRDLRLARILCGTYIPSKRWFDKVAQIGPEKSAPECPFEWRGGGGAIAIWAMPQ